MHCGLICDIFYFSVQSNLPFYYPEFVSLKGKVVEDLEFYLEVYEFIAHNYNCYSFKTILSVYKYNFNGNYSISNPRLYIYIYLYCLVDALNHFDCATQGLPTKNEIIKLYLTSDDLVRSTNSTLQPFTFLLTPCVKSVAPDCSTTSHCVQT